MSRDSAVYRVLGIVLLCVVAFAALAQDSDGTTYIVREGETLGGVAERLEVPVECIRAANELNEDAELTVGQELLIPDDCSAFTEAGGGETAAAPEATREPVIPLLTEDEVYTVVRGDRLARIARRYGVTVACLARANRIPNPDLIFVGQQIIIPVGCQQGGGGDTTTVVGTSGDTTSVRSETTTCQFDRNAGRTATNGLYTVRAGDMLDFIACDFGISLACLVQSNPQVENRGTISIGEQLTIDLSCPPWEGPILAMERE